MPSLFITGIGTDVGKTVVTAGLAGLALSRGERVCVYKPVQTGSPVDAPEDARRIRQWCGQDVPVESSYVFAEPAAPLVADEAHEIRLNRLIEDFKRLRREYDTLLVEGAGGLRVPITPELEMVELIKIYNFPILLVARPYLGAINHTLLSTESLVRRRLPVAGVVVSGSPPSDQSKAVSSFCQTLEPFIEVPLLGTLPEFDLKDGCFAPGAPALEKFQQIENSLRSLELA